ncbi:ABC transporter ATP-binding protein [Jiangella rhizosphaerae]|uniref:ABC transporter ATP-binding protein n=1 Tax=Jiangella rhizosphaerae TaxID=2293569 RepID=UPI001313E334|nr:ABC transporter ATP-binding protein [Jiangella rhizosphaerae]
MTATPLLEVEDLHLSYELRDRTVHALQGATLHVGRSEIVGIVGESGSGKSTVARAALGLLPWGVAHITGGAIRVEGADVTRFGPRQWPKLRGHPLAMVFQDPLSFLNPVVRVGRQIAEGVAKHDPGADRTRRVAELLDLVRLPAEVAQSFPHELSGGMRQRVLLAIALGCRPKLLVADEPTTALDVTTQADIIALLRDIRDTLDLSILLISHDLAVVATMCDRIYTMYGGHTVETGPTADVLRRPGHPYTYGLMQSARAVRDEHGRYATIPGQPPNLAVEFPGCPFSGRCPVEVEPCGTRFPPSARVSGAETHLAWCWRLVEQHAGDVAVTA